MGFFMGKVPRFANYRAKSKRSGGAGGIRTLDTLLTYTHFPGERLRPLGHRSAYLTGSDALTTAIHLRKPWLGIFTRHQRINRKNGARPPSFVFTAGLALRRWRGRACADRPIALAIANSARILMAFGPPFQNARLGASQPMFKPCCGAIINGKNHEFHRRPPAAFWCHR